MTYDMDHERCSELLTEYVRGRLDRPQEAAVEHHLSDCHDCRVERRAVQALVIGAHAQLQDHERASLREAVWKEAGVARAPVVKLERKWDRTARILGAAALVAVLVTGLFYLGGTGGGEDFGGDTTGAAGGAAEEAPGRDRANEDGRPGRPEALDKQEDATAAQGQTDNAVVAQPTFAPAGGDLSDQELRDLGSGKLFRGLSAAYANADSDRVRARLTADLAEQAPDELSDQIRSCSQRVFDMSPPRVVPAYGTEATLQGRRVLVLGFAYSKAAGGPLDRFMFWAWPRGSCEPAVDYEEGAIPGRP